MILHDELINYVAKKIKAKYYLEIGTFNPDHNFNRIAVKNKITVDPDQKTRPTWIMTSDEFFKGMETLNVEKDCFDLVFIDGLHHADQVRRDIINSWGYLSSGGVIICHDSNPPTVETTCVPRGSQREWCGSVFKTICQIISPNKFTVDIDYGNCVLHKNGEPLEFVDHDVSWQDFDENRKELLNLVSVEDAIKIIDTWK